MKLKKGKKRKKKESTWGKLLLAVVMLLHVLCTILLRASERKATIKAVKQDEQVKLLYRTEKTTKLV